MSAMLTAGIITVVIGMICGLSTFIGGLVNMKKAIDDGLDNKTFTRHLGVIAGLAISGFVTMMGIVLLAIGLYQKYGG